MSKLFLSLFKIETPPRAWGRLPDVNKAALLARNTPTCVGKTKPLTNTGATIKKHPHVRGEDHRDSAGRVRGAETPPRAWGTLSESMSVVKEETPPRAWGRLAILEPPTALIRNTPTCVGKTQVQGYSRATSQKHPHVRGEDLLRSGGIENISETPPRAWGRLLRDSFKKIYTRNTPTCVGKTQRKTAALTLRKKHPHVRGEDLQPEACRTPCLETPPRAWGRPRGSRMPAGPLRNTPTCVGKTLALAHGYGRPEKHPHVRGEDWGRERKSL